MLAINTPCPKITPPLTLTAEALMESMVVIGVPEHFRTGEAVTAKPQRH